MKKVFSLIFCVILFSAFALALSSCGLFNKNEPKEHAHTLGEWFVSVAPTCAENGTQKRVCTSEGCTYYETKSIIATGHDLVSEKGVPNSCISIGWNDYEKCTKCSYSTYEEIPATGHVYNQDICRNCGQEHIHSYGDWYGDTATCSGTGLKYRKCVGCTHVESTPTPAIAHKVDGGVCTVCHEEVEQEDNGDDIVLPPEIFEE
ncbi:MAG: hypothetical protein IJY23_08550 [Clostridia bacterium]|nr:hypothetical protein [Clostridia bacterium]